MNKKALHDELAFGKQRSELICGQDIDFVEETLRESRVPVN
jgi:hypothetical protein